MKIEVATGVVGRDFAFSPGDVVDQEEFAAKVGPGWNALCTNPEEGSGTPERAIRTPVAERAVKRRGRR